MCVCVTVPIVVVVIITLGDKDRGRYSRKRLKIVVCDELKISVTCTRVPQILQEEIEIESVETDDINYRGVNEHGYADDRY